MEGLSPRQKEVLELVLDTVSSDSPSRLSTTLNDMYLNSGFKWSSSRLFPVVRALEKKGYIVTKQEGHHFSGTRVIPLVSGTWETPLEVEDE